MGVVVQGHFDRFRPVSFDVEPDKALSMHADFHIATEILQWAQEVRQRSVSAGLDERTRAQMLCIWGTAKDHPEP